MDYETCEKIYQKWEETFKGKVLIKEKWVLIDDITEDAHLGWIIVTENETIQMNEIKKENIKIGHVKLLRIKNDHKR